MLGHQVRVPGSGARVGHQVPVPGSGPRFRCQGRAPGSGARVGHQVPVPDSGTRFQNFTSNRFDQNYIPTRQFCKNKTIGGVSRRIGFWLLMPLNFRKFLFVYCLNQGLLKRKKKKKVFSCSHSLFFSVGQLPVGFPKDQTNVCCVAFVLEWNKKNVACEWFSSIVTRKSM